MNFVQPSGTLRTSTGNTSHLGWLGNPPTTYRTGITALTRLIVAISPKYLPHLMSHHRHITIV